MRSLNPYFLLVLFLVSGFFCANPSLAQAGGTLSATTGNDNQVQINAALSSGGTVHLNAGQYVINDTIVLKSNTVLEGDTGAKIVLVGNANWPKNKNMIEGLNVSNVRITGFEVDGNRANNTSSNGTATACGKYFYTMIYFKGSSAIEIDNMYLHHNWNDILKFSASSNVKFHNNTVRQPGHDVVYAIGSSDVWVYDNYIRIYCNSGIRPDGTKNIYIYGNDIARDEGAGGYAGIEIQGASTVFICNNNIHDCKGGSVVDLSSGAAKISYSGCPASGTGGTGASAGTGSSTDTGTTATGGTVYTPGSTTTTDANGNTTTTVSDSSGNTTVTATSAAGAITTTTTDATGNVTSTGTGTTTTDANGNTTTTVTDSSGNTTNTTTTAAGNMTSTTTDSSGEVIATSTGTASTDENGSLILTTTDSEGNTTTTTVDSTGYLTSSTVDPAGNEISNSTGTTSADMGSPNSIDNNVEGNDIYEYFDPTGALTDLLGLGAGEAALAPPPTAIAALFAALSQSAPATAIDTCGSIEEKGGFLPCGRNYDNPDTSWNECDQCSLCSMILMGQLSITFLIKFAAFAATLSIIFAGFVYVFALGKADLVRQAKMMIVYSLIGVIIIIFAWAIVDGILTTLGYIDPLGDSWYTVC